MKAVTLAVMLADGTYKSVAGPASAAILDVAREVRATGEFGKKQALYGVVLSSESPHPLMRFKVEAKK